MAMCCVSKLVVRAEFKNHRLDRSIFRLFLLSLQVLVVAEVFVLLFRSIVPPCTPDDYNGRLFQGRFLHLELPPLLGFQH